MTDLPSLRATYADLFERMWDAALIVDRNDFKVLEANPAFERILGFNTQEILGTTVLEFVSPAYLDGFSKALRVARRRYYPRTFESIWKTQDQRQLYVEVLLCMLKLNDEQEVMQVVVKDITRQRIAEMKAQKYLEELKQLNSKLEELSVTDEMTGLFNYRFFSQSLEKEHARAERYGTPYSIIFCDVDYFKVYNDTNGHRAGDVVLRQVSEIMKYATRKTDRPARYGGEEFVVLCPGVNWEGAQVLAERLREEVEKHKFENQEAQPQGNLTISVGIASYPSDGSSYEQIIKSADHALYYSKEHGRNQVTSARELRFREESEKFNKTGS